MDFKRQDESVRADKVQVVWFIVKRPSNYPTRIDGGPHRPYLACPVATHTDGRTESVCGLVGGGRSAADLYVP